MRPYSSQRHIKALYHDICGYFTRDYQGRRAFDQLLGPALRDLAGFAEEFAGLRQLATSLPTPRVPGVFDGAVDTGIWTFYALSRVADMMLLPLQDIAARQASDPPLSFGVADAAIEDVLRLFEPLGMTAMPSHTFRPIFHEVVEVIEEPSLGEHVEVGEVIWPGLMFGNMVFLRAGVRVLCSRAVMAPELAGLTMLHSTFLRRDRPTYDLSHGWGSGSQWGTDLRRDYAEDGILHYNVDGKFILSRDGYTLAPHAITDRQFRGRPVHQRSSCQDDLTPLECIELLTHRCFVRTTKLDRHRWLFDDCYSEPAIPETS